MRVALVLYQRTQARSAVATLQGMPIVFSSNDLRNERTGNRRSYHSSKSFSVSFNDKHNVSKGGTSSHFQRLQAMFKSTLAPVAASSGNEKESEVDKKKNAFITDLGLPSLLPEWKKMFNKDTVFTDVSAGLTVGCIAVPLSLAIAVASGVPAEVGLVTAAVSGVAGGMLGGTTLAVTGPAAAISLLIVDAVQTHGLEALPFITLACGGLQLASGVTRLGVVAKLVPVSVIAGFTTGVGTLILTGQLPKALGMTATPAGLNPVELLGYIGENLSTINPSAAALAVGTSAAMFYLPKLHPAMPSALMAVGGATLATHTLGLDVSLIGAIPSGLEAFKFGLPMMPSVESLPSLCTTIGLIYAMTSVESLLSCAALDKMKKTSYKHNPDQELVGQGIANMASSMFMGMPVTSVIARSGLNVRLNAETRLPAIVQAGFVFSSVVFLSDKIAMIPMPALSGVLITTGMGMLNPVEFKHCYSVQKIDALPFATTIGGMISLGLAEGIGIGCATAVALNYRDWSKSSTTMQNNLSRMEAQEAYGIHHAVRLPVSSKSIQSGHGGASPLASHGNHSPLHEHHHDQHDFQMHYTTDVRQPASNWMFSDSTGQDFTMDSTSSAVWHLKGPINFLSMFAIDDLIRTVKERLSSEDKPEALVLDMHQVTNLEFTGVEELTNRLVEVADTHENTSIQMVNCSDALHRAMDQCDPSGQIRRYSNLASASK